MAQMTPFRRVVDAVRPLMKGTRNLGVFTARLIDMGMQAARDPRDERSALQLRSAASWKGYANGSSSLPSNLASEIASRWDEVTFGGNVTENYGETALISLATNLRQLDPSINKGNCAEGLGRLLYNTFLELSGAQTPAPPSEEQEVQRIEHSGHPYFDSKTNRIRLGEYSTAAAARCEGTGRGTCVCHASARGVLRAAIQRWNAGNGDRHPRSSREAFSGSAKGVLQRGVAQGDILELLPRWSSGV